MKNILGILDKPNLPSLLLRTGLAIVFTYAAIGSLTNPDEWIGYLPSILTDHFPSSLLLGGFSVYELLLAAWLLRGVYLRWAALLCAATLGGIVASNLSIFIITFRDVALIFAALALAALASNKKA